MINGLCDVRYGIAYQSASREYPDGYAHGFVKTTLEDLRTMINHDHKVAQSPEPRISTELIHI